MRNRVLFTKIILFIFLLVSAGMAFAEVEIRCVGSSYEQAGCRISIKDASGRTRFKLSIDCTNCHKTPFKSGEDPKKAFDSKSQVAFSQKCIDAMLPKNVDGTSRFIVQENKRYQWEKGVYFFKEKGRLVLINENENYKLLFEDDAVVVKDRDGRPGLITTAYDVKKTTPFNSKDLQPRK